MIDFVQSLAPVQLIITTMSVFISTRSRPLSVLEHRIATIYIDMFAKLANIFTILGFLILNFILFNFAYKQIKLTFLFIYSIYEIN